MYLQDTENKQSSTGASESGQLSDDSLRSEDYTSYGQGSPFPPGESAIPPKMTGGVPEFSLGQWLLVHLLLAIPIVNLILLLIWAIGEPKPGKEVLTNYSRAHLIVQTAGVSIRTGNSLRWNITAFFVGQKPIKRIYLSLNEELQSVAVLFLFRASFPYILSMVK